MIQTKTFNSFNANDLEADLNAWIQAHQDQMQVIDLQFQASAAGSYTHYSAMIVYRVTDPNFVTDY